LLVMRQHRTISVLVVFVCLLTMTSCGTSKPTTPPGSSQNPTVHPPEPARATPSVSAKLVCAHDTQNELAAVLGVHTTKPVVPTWVRASHLYSCRYTYRNGVIALSLKELSSKTETDAYFTSLARRLGQTQRPLALGQGIFFPTKNGSAVVRKDYKVLLVDISGLPAQFGSPPFSRANIALTVAATILDCWSGA
jgi:hypothetical protein